MKINGMIDIESLYSITQSNSHKENITPGNTVYDVNPSMDSLTISQKDELKISTAAMTSLLLEQDQSIKTFNDETSESGRSDNDALKIEILRNLLRLISVKDYNSYTLQPQFDPDATVDKLKSLIIQAQVTIKNNQSLPKQPFELDIFNVETQPGNEQLTIKASGLAKTADNQLIDFDVQLKMDRQYFRQNDLISPVSVDVHI